MVAAAGSSPRWLFIKNLDQVKGAILPSNTELMLHFLCLGIIRKNHTRRSDSRREWPRGSGSSNAEVEVR